MALKVLELTKINSKSIRKEPQNLDWIQICDDRL